MSDTTTIPSSNEGNELVGQKQLAAGKEVALRLWENEPPTDQKAETQREYETVGYVLTGKAELYCDGKKTLLTTGDSWVVPRGSKHRYQILETFTAIEATSPPFGASGAAKVAEDGCAEKNEKAEQEHKSERAKDVAAAIPRTTENITSNAPEKKRVPSEHEDIEK
jgi:quercetin dioxygenase-like cupin family protein